MQEPELHNLLMPAGDAAFIIGPDCTIRMWNQAAEKLFGFSACEVLTRSCASVLQGTGKGGEPFCSLECPLLEMSKRGTPVPAFDMEVGTYKRHWINISTIFARTPTTHLIIHLARDINSHARLEAVTRLFLQELCALTGQRVEDLLASTPTPNSVLNSILTDRERQVISLLAQGKGTKAIAQEFEISPATVRNHVQQILRKLHAHSRMEAVSRALRERIT